MHDHLQNRSRCHKLEGPSPHFHHHQNLSSHVMVIKKSMQIYNVFYTVTLLLAVLTEDGKI
jgi:hypothetical protein